MAGNDGVPGSAENPGTPDDAARLSQDGTGPIPGVQSLPDIAPGILTSEDDARRRELLEAACGYARHAWKVTPVRWITDEGICSCHRGSECPSPGKHPVHDDWPNVASNDLDVVSQWWRPEPKGIARDWFPIANIGLVTGRDSGIFVLDVDTYAGGAQTLGAYERRNGAMPETRVHQTGRGGQHFFFKHPGFSVRNSAKKVLGAGLDIRGENGFVVAPPSVSLGGPYELNPVHDIAPAEAPEWLLKLLRTHDDDQSGASISGDEPAASSGQARRYAEAALAMEAERMRNAGEGTRNDTLNQCAFTLGTLGGAGLLSEDQAWNALHEAALAAGLGEGEIRGTFYSGWRDGLDHPRMVQWRAVGTDWPTRPRTEFGLADRMADHFGDMLRWCPEMGTWVIYRNGVWEGGAKESGEWYAQAMLRRLADTEALSYDDTKLIPDGDAATKSDRDLFIEWVGKNHTRKAVSAAARLATGLAVMKMSQSSFDADPLALNVRNGVVNLNTGELEPHSPEQRMTLQCHAYFRGLDEPAPKWEAFLRRVQPDPEVRAYLQRVAGYCATGLTTEQVFFLMHGKLGANGKSVWQNVLSRILGTYSQAMPVETLMASSVDGRIPNDVARMAGKRFLAAAETKAGKALDEQRLKQLTGGDTVAARYMRAEWFEFRMVGKMLLTSNHLPKISDDSATWRRIHLILWPTHIPEHERDGLLEETLVREEAAGILAWIIRGALAWREDGLNPPGAVVRAREEYQREEDVVGQFIEDELEEVAPANGVPGRGASDIWHAYRQWATREGHTVMGQRMLTSRISKHKDANGKPHAYVRSNGWAGFPGLQVKIFRPEGGTE
jgi:putative DNA primase/helicase